MDSITLTPNTYTPSVDENQLIELPESLGNCSQLQELDFYDNQLTWLPESFVHLRIGFNLPYLSVSKPPVMK